MSDDSSMDVSSSFASLSPKLLNILDRTVETSIKIFFGIEIVNCLGDNELVVPETPSEIQSMFLDCELYLEQAKTKIDYNKSDENVFTGRYMLCNHVGTKRLNPHRKELIDWAEKYIPVENRRLNKDPYVDDAEFYAWVWLAYLRNYHTKVTDFFLNEKKYISVIYL
jgi:hypothetical protein